MGASFTNVQVHTANRDPAEMRAIVAERLRQWMAQNSYEDLEEDGGEPDRTILVAPAGHEPWIAVYDEFTESQDERDLQELARVLSAATDGAAIAVLDHDSDILGLWLYRSGQLTDAYNSSPDFWGEVSPSEREEVVGRPEMWRDMLVPGASLDDLAAAFARKDTFAEDTLLRLGDLLGLNPERIQVGFNDLEREYVTVTSAGLTRERPDLTGFARLPFRLTSGPALRSVAGLPNLHPGGGAIECTLAVDERLGVGEQHVRSASASNVGGPLKGLRIVFWGSALDDGLIEPEGASLVTR